MTSEEKHRQSTPAQHGTQSHTGADEVRYTLTVHTLKYANAQAYSCDTTQVRAPVPLDA